MYRITILLYEMEERFQSPEAELQWALHQAGFVAEFSQKSQKDLDMNPDRVAEFVRQTPSDAWVVFAAPKEVLDWFAEQPFPALAVFGQLPPRMAGIGPTHRDAVEACIDELLRLGHQKITMIARKERRKPTPGIIERLLLDRLAEKGLPVTHQTLPDWEESLSGFRACLASLFEQSPPTAMIFQEPELVMAAQQFFAQQGLRIPENVSLFCCDYDPRFEWSVPTVAHSHWDYREVVQRTVDWARNVSSGKTDHEITVMRAKFAPGGTIGPPPSGSLHRGTSGEVW